MDVSITFSIKPEIVREWFPSNSSSSEKVTPNEPNVSKESTKDAPRINCNLAKANTISKEDIEKNVNLVKNLILSNTDSQTGEYLTNWINFFSQFYNPQQQKSAAKTTNDDKKSEESKGLEDLEDVVENIISQKESELPSYERCKTIIKDKIDLIFKDAKEFSDNKDCFHTLIGAIFVDNELSSIVKQDKSISDKAYVFLITSVKKYCQNEKEFRDYSHIFGTLFVSIEIRNSNSIPDLISTVGAMIISPPSKTNKKKSSSSSASGKKPAKSDSCIPPYSE